MTLLKRFLPPTTEPVPLVEHPKLGVLRYDAESGTWGKEVTISGHAVRLSVTGQRTPDPGLLSQLTRAESDLPELLSRIPAFLESAAVETPEVAAEIRSLVVGEVGVWWPKQPDAAMVWFKGPSERVWHCDYQRGKLSGLAFDD